MAILLLLVYAAICVVAFHFFRVPVNRWTVTTGTVGGAIVVGGLLAGMNFNHPFTNDARIYFFTTAIAPAVSGPVVEVTAEPNVRIEKGALLFRLDPRPYQYAVNQKRAALAEAEQNVRQLKASLDQAEAGVGRARAQFELAEQSYARQADLVKKQVSSQAVFDSATRNLDAARQALSGAQAASERARLAYTSDIDGINTTVARLQEELRTAEYDLSQTKVVAPTDGYVAQMLLRPGMVASPRTPAMVFIHADDTVFAAAFAQNVVSRLSINNKAEAIFPALPGRVFSGKVRTFANAVSQGELQSSRTLINPVERSSSQGDVMVRIDLDQDVQALGVPAGGAAQVAVYSDHWQPVAIIRRVLLRMKSWLHYLG